MVLIKTKFMKKLLFVFPVVALLAAGCGSPQQVSNQTPIQAPSAKNTNPVSVSTPTPSPIATPSSTPPTGSQSSYITTNLTPASVGIANPYQIVANSFNSPLVGKVSNNIAGFQIVVSAAARVTLTSITLQANQSVGNSLPLTNLGIYALRDGVANNGLSDQAFGKTVVGPIVAGQTYTFSDSMSIPANGIVDLLVRAYVSGATPGSYGAPFTLTNISGMVTGNETKLLFSGNLKGQNLIVQTPPATISVPVSLDPSSPPPVSVSPGSQNITLMIFKLINPSSQPLQIGFGAYFGNSLKFTDLSNVYWYDETGLLVGKSFTSDFSCPSICNSLSGTYSDVEIKNNDWYIIPANSTKTITIKADISASAIVGDSITPSLSTDTLKALSTGSIVNLSGLPLSGSKVIIQ